MAPIQHFNSPLMSASKIVQLPVNIRSPQAHDTRLRTRELPLRRLAGPRHVRSVQLRDLPVICQWIKTKEELLLVSSDVADELDASILQGWLNVSEMALVLCGYQDELPLAFCTLTSREAPQIPSNAIEICHLIVAPERRYLFEASRIVSEAFARAAILGAKWVYGRIVPHNVHALALAKFKRMGEVTGSEDRLVPGFRWFKIRSGLVLNQPLQLL